MSFFKDLEDFARGFVTTVGGIVDDVASAIARPLGVHPDVVKVAAAALGMYYQAGGFATAAGEAVSEAAAADLIAAHGADALTAANQMEAAATLAAATGTALPYSVDPAMLASQLAAEGSICGAHCVYRRHFHCADRRLFDRKRSIRRCGAIDDGY
jgi:hypothetical protein